MAKDRGSTHVFAALLVACGLASFALLEWRLSTTLSHHPTRHERDGPWLRPRVYHRRKEHALLAVRGAPSSAAAAEDAAARAARAADRAFAAASTAKNAAKRSSARVAAEDAAFAAHNALVPPPRARRVPHLPTKPRTACDLPASMRYWRSPESSDADVRLLKEGRVPLLKGDRFLTFVPDLGGFNNIRLALENMVVLARTTGRTLVLPPPQTYYLFKACKEKCAFGLEELLPGLLARKDLVMTSRAFLGVAVPKLRRQGRFTRPRGRTEPVTPVAQPVLVDRCTPTRKATDSCFTWYAWLEENFGDALNFPDVGKQCVVFGANKARARGLEVDEHIADFCAPRTSIVQGQSRRVVDGDAYYGSNDTILHVRTSGVSTHYHSMWHGKPKGDSSIEPARMGRLLAPFYAYIHHADPSIANFYKRLVRDVVRFNEPRVMCVSARIVEWLVATGSYVSVHARRNEFQFVEANKDLGAASLRDTVRRTVGDAVTVYVATDERDPAFFDALRADGPVVLLSELVEAARNTSRGLRLRPRADGRAWPLDHVLYALNSINGNELGFVDALIASQGTVFTGAWFSTYTGLVNRLRGYGGFADASSYFSTPGREAAFQGFEAPRSPLYMREWVQGWRGIDGDVEAGPLPGERVFGELAGGAYPESS